MMVTRECFAVSEISLRNELSHSNGNFSSVWPNTIRCYCAQLLKHDLPCSNEIEVTEKIGWKNKQRISNLTSWLQLGRTMRRFMQFLFELLRAHYCERCILSAKEKNLSSDSSLSIINWYVFWQTSSSAITVYFQAVMFFKLFRD